MRIFVTGGSGFVGGHVIERLAGDHEVLAMARSDASARAVEALGARAVRCSLEELAPGALDGVDAVVHAAAFVEEWGTEAQYREANVDGTQRLVDAAKAAGVARFVLVSTNATVFEAGGQLGVDESAPYTTLGHFAYGHTKAEAERRVLAANGDGFTTVSLRPCFIWGPRDRTLVPALARMVEEGSFVWLDGGRAQVSTTHVHNLVHAIACALVDGRGGEAYFIADDGDTTVRGFLNDLAHGAGLALPARSVPGWMARVAAAGLETTWRGLGRADLPPVTRMAAWLMSSDMTVKTDKARRELGWVPVVGRDAAVDALAA